MATVLRVKRRVVDDHPEALVIAKKRKANDDGQSDDTADETSSTTVLKFAGTTNIRVSYIFVYKHLGPSVFFLSASDEIRLIKSVTGGQRR